MSKGCFLKFIIILTIVVASGLYIVQTKFDEWILQPGKGLIKEAFNDNWKEEFAFVKPGVQKDSLKFLIENYIDSLRSTDISEEDIDYIRKSVEAALVDSLINDKELEKLQNLLRVKK